MIVIRVKMKIQNKLKALAATFVGLLVIQNADAVEITPKSPFANEVENSIALDASSNMGWFDIGESEWFLIKPDVDTGTVLISTEGSEPFHRLAVFQISKDSVNAEDPDFEDYFNLTLDLDRHNVSYNRTIKIDVDEDYIYWLMVSPYIENGHNPLSPFRLIACETTITSDKIHGFSSPPSVSGTVYMHGEWYGMGDEGTESWNIARFIPEVSIGLNGFPVGFVEGEWRALAETEDYQNGTYDPINYLYVDYFSERVVVFAHNGTLWENGRQINFSEHITFHPDYPYPGYQWWVEYNYGG